MNKILNNKFKIIKMNLKHNNNIKIKYYNQKIIYNKLLWKIMN